MPSPDLAIPTRAPAEVSADDTVLPFEVPALDLRGRVVRLGPAVDAILESHDYPQPVAKLLGEAVATRRLRTDFGWPMLGRSAVGLAGGVVCPLALLGMGARATWPALAVATLMLGGVLIGELVERSMFFTAASPPR